MIDFISDDDFVRSLKLHWSVSAVENQWTLLEIYSLNADRKE